MGVSVNWERGTREEEDYLLEKRLVSLQRGEEGVEWFPAELGQDRQYVANQRSGKRSLGWVGGAAGVVAAARMGSAKEGCGFRKKKGHGGSSEKL